MTFFIDKVVNISHFYLASSKILRIFALLIDIGQRTDSTALRGLGQPHTKQQFY
jgi:hypothetical protein